MRLTSFFLLATPLFVFLNGCVTHQPPTRYAANLIHRQNVQVVTKDRHAPKDPQHIKLYSQNIVPLKPYRIIGVASVSKYNLVGKKRQDETVHEMMKKLAASIGGDALINVDTKGEVIKANIIQFRHILL